MSPIAECHDNAYALLRLLALDADRPSTLRGQDEGQVFAVQEEAQLLAVDGGEDIVVRVHHSDVEGPIAEGTIPFVEYEWEECGVVSMFDQQNTLRYLRDILQPFQEWCSCIVSVWHKGALLWKMASPFQKGPGAFASFEASREGEELWRISFDGSAFSSPLRLPSVDTANYDNQGEEIVSEVRVRLWVDCAIIPPFGSGNARPREMEKVILANPIRIEGLRLELVPQAHSWYPPSLYHMLKSVDLWRKIEKWMCETEAELSQWLKARFRDSVLIFDVLDGNGEAMAFYATPLVISRLGGRMRMPLVFAHNRKGWFGGRLTWVDGKEPKSADELNDKYGFRLRLFDTREGRIETVAGRKVRGKSLGRYLSPCPRLLWFEPYYIDVPAKASGGVGVRFKLYVRYTRKRIHKLVVNPFRSTIAMMRCIEMCLAGVVMSIS